MDKEKIEVSNLLVICDDIALPLGTIRIRPKGGDGGHNGLLSIIETLAISDFARLRFGIGSDFAKGFQSDYVLGRWSNDEIKLLPARIDICIDVIKSFALQGLERTMNAYNKK